MTSATPLEIVLAVNKIVAKLERRKVLGGVT